MFEKQRVAREEFELAKKNYNDHTSTVTKQRENLKFFSIEDIDDEIMYDESSIMLIGE